MRKWVLYIDLILLLTCLALLIIDLQIKNDLVDQMKQMQGVVDGQKGQGSTERDNSDSSVSDILLCGHDDSSTAVETQAVEDAKSEGTKQAPRNSSRTKRNSRAFDSGVQSVGEQVGS